MGDFPEIKSKHSLVAKYVTKPLWEKLSTITTKTSNFTLAKAIACAVQVLLRPKLHHHVFIFLLFLLLFLLLHFHPDPAPPVR